MGLTVRQLFESLTTHGIMPAGDASTLREKSQAELDNDAEPLLRDLIRLNKLTKFQAANLYSGRGKGLVFGEYLVLDKIGAGGMGQVYKAQHRKMKRIVALKVLPPQSVGSAKAVQRFYQEVEVAAKLTHTNIVTAYDAGEAHGMLYLVMEFVDGKDLSSHISKHGPLTLEQTLNVVLQTARGLTYAHGLGIIHRDIKPSNLLVNRDKVVKILDMGLARVHSPLGDTGPVAAELTASGEVMGTIDYMAPEQAIDTRTADHRADIYALGCTLYRLYVGRAPFAGETAVQKILAHRDKPIPSLRQARPETPDMVERLYQKMLAKNLNERTQTMASVVATLERLLSGVDDERSSVMLGSEPVEDDGTFMPSGVALGGSSLGGLPAGSSLGPGQSGVQKAKPAGSSIGGAAYPPLPTVAAVSQAGTAPQRYPNDTDSGGQTKPFAQVTTRTTAQAAQAKPAQNKPGNKTLLLVGGACTAVAVAAAAAFFAFGGNAPTTPELAGPGATPPAPSATRPAASPSSSTVKIASLPVPVPTATPSPTFSFDLPTTPTTTTTSPTPPNFTTTVPEPPAPGNFPTTAIVPMQQSELLGEIDLLALIDPAKHKRRGNWIRRGNELVLDSAGPGGTQYLDVPFAPPEEYDLTCVAVPTVVNIAFGPGIIYGGRSCSVLANDDKLGLAMVDGRGAYDGKNSTFRQGPYFTINAPVTIVCAVRRNRIAVILDNKRLIDMDLSAERLSPEEAAMVTPGQLFLRSGNGIQYTSLRIGPPLLPMLPPSAAVNLAAAFEQSNVAEGSASQRRGEVLLTSQPNTYAKLQFTQPRSDAYIARAVVERTAGGGSLFVCLPHGQRRVSATIDYSDEKIVGLQSVGAGGVDINSTGRRAGLLLPPGELHVVEVRTGPDRDGYYFNVTVDGRVWVNHTSNDFRPEGPNDVPDRLALGLSLWNGSLRIVRFDQLPADGRRLPVPETQARATAAETVRGLTSSADAKGAPLDAKLLAVDLLRKKAAVELNDTTLRYEALDAAVRIAASAGDLAGAYEAVEDLVLAFDVDPRGQHPRLLECFKLPRTQTAAKQQFADEALKLIERAAHSAQFELALDLNGALDKFIGSTNADVKRELKARTAEYELARSLQTSAVEARAKLADDANDAAARVTVGKYLCFGLADWGGGLKELLKGNDAGLQAAASLELGDVSTGDAKFAVAEKWLDLSDQEKLPALKWTYLERAAYWYRRAAANLSDAKRPLLGRQMTKIAQTRKTSGGAGGPRRPLDAVKIGEHWYQFYAFPMHWDAAAQSCENWGGNMLVVDNAAESQAVAQFALQRLTTLGTERANIWLGATDVDKEGQFRRIDGVMLTPQTYSSWYGSEPNNANGDEDYVTMGVSLSSGQISAEWMDVSKAALSFTVCEWDH